MTPQATFMAGSKKITSATRRRRRRPRHFSPLRFAGRLLLAFLKLSLIVLLCGVVGGLWLYYRYGTDLPDPAEIGRHRSFETTQIYARDGQTLLYELVGSEDGRRTVVSFEQIPPLLKQATIAVEDAGFYENPGVDARGILRALWQNYQSGEIVSGASTITMQLVRNILLDPQERSELSYERKLREAMLAFQVSQRYSKDQILGIYLNEVYYGAQAYGVEAAAQTYFGKHVWDLTPGEMTLIAGLPQSPTMLNPFTNFEGARYRQRVTLDAMVKAGVLSRSDADTVFAETIHLIAPTTGIVAPHFVFYVRDQLERRYGPEVLYRAGLRVTTSIDLYWQNRAEQIARQRIEELRPRNASNAGVIILAPDGQILAMVGSIDYTSPEGQNNVTLARRQPGSALKPFVYAAALQRGWTPATVIWDTPSEWVNADGVAYRPQNYDNRFHGPMRLRMALANSLNIPAVKAMEYVGIANFVDLAGRVGISTFDDPTRQGLAMALGSNEVRLLDLSVAYNTLRNGGHYQQPVSILKVTNSRGELVERWQPSVGPQALGPQGEQVAYLLTNMLSDNQARRYMFGANNVMELPEGFVAAAKTGTSNDWRDSWAMGYTQDVTIGVWVGNFDNTPMSEVAGSNGAGIIWRDLMLAYHEGRGAAAFPAPAGVIEQAICADTGGLAGSACPRPMREYFIAGSEPKVADVTYRTVRVGGDGSCLAASYTPTDQVREVSFPVYPPQFNEWAARNAPQPPTQYCPPPAAPASDQAFARLTPIGASGVVTGNQVYINGSARGAFTLTVDGPGGAQTIAQSYAAIPEGLLAIWNLAGLPAGDYTLRLTVTTPEGVTVSDQQLVSYRP
jgi:1A family penicillin-binding protein